MFVSSDNSKWNIMLASELCQIPIWNGNRTIDENHITRIESDISSLKHLNLNPYRVAIIEEDGQEHKFIIDGQHRATILVRNLDKVKSEDFNVMVLQKKYSNETEIINYFKIFNATKSIPWKEDPKLVANKYVELLIKEFNKKSQFIRAGRTAKPYLSSDRIREALIQRHVVDWKTTPEEFVLRCREINDQQIELIDTTTLNNRRAKELGFVLGILDFKWM
jgi:hypothetical protein